MANDQSAPHADPGPVVRPVPAGSADVGAAQAGARTGGLFAADELARAFEVPGSVIHAAYRNGKLRAVRPVPKTVRFSRDAVADYLRDARRPAMGTSSRALEVQLARMLDAIGTTDGPHWYTTEAASAASGYSREDIDRLIAAREVTAYRFGKRYRVFSEDLEAAFARPAPADEDLAVPGPGPVPKAGSGEPDRAAGPTKPRARAPIATPLLVAPKLSDAQCAGIGPDAAKDFFSERLESVRKAQAICAECEVQEPCLEGALQRGEFAGVWGGQMFRAGAVIDPMRIRTNRVARKAVAPSETQSPSAPGSDGSPALERGMQRP